MRKPSTAKSCRISTWFVELYSDRRAIALPMAAVLFAVLLGFMGLVLDGGRLYFEKRRMQVAADAGAMGGAHELWRRNFSMVEAAAQNDARLNSFDDTDPDVTVEVYNPPVSGARTGDNSFVEVIISQPIPSYFMRILNFDQTTVRARAVAGTVPYQDVCILALDRDDPDTPLSKTVF